MIAFVHEADHSIHAVEQAQAERLEFEGDVYVLPVGVIAEAAAAFETPLPLGFGRNDSRCQMYSPRTSRIFFARQARRESMNLLERSIANSAPAVENQ